MRWPHADRRQNDARSLSEDCDRRAGPDGLHPAARQSAGRPWRPSRDYRETYTAQASQGGGILLDASHEIDYVRWIAGDISGVFARAEHLSDLSLDVEDTAALVLRMERGVHAA